MSHTVRAIRALPLVALLALVALPAAAQVRSRDRDWGRCSTWDGDRDMERVCNVTEATIAEVAGKA